MAKYGPNVTKLIARFIAREAIPPGGGIVDGIEFFLDQERRKQIVKRAEDGAITAISLIKLAPDNPYGDDDEEIAGMLLEKINKRIDEQRRANRASKD